MEQSLVAYNVTMKMLYAAKGIATMKILYAPKGIVLDSSLVYITRKHACLPLHFLNSSHTPSHSNSLTRLNSSRIPPTYSFTLTSTDYLQYNKLPQHRRAIQHTWTTSTTPYHPVNPESHEKLDLSSWLPPDPGLLSISQGLRGSAVGTSTTKAMRCIQPTQSW